MKKLLLIFALVFSHFFNVNAQKEKLDILFEKYQETEGVTSIKIGKPMFSMLSKLNIDDEDLSQIKPLLNKINGLKILIIEKPDTSENPTSEDKKQFGIFQNLQADISNSIKNMKYEELITVNSKDSKIKFLSSDAKNGILDNLLLSINSDDDIILMILDGKISMEDVNKLANEVQNSSTKSSVATENITSSGVTQVRNVGKFTGIKVSNGIKVNFTQGNNQTVIVETDPNLQEYVSTEVQNGILVLSVNNKKSKSVNFKKLLVTIEAPHLSSVDLSSGSLLTTVNTIKENSFQAEVSSGSNLNADVKAETTVNLKATSGASMRVYANTVNLIFNGNSGSSSVIEGKAEKSSYVTSSAASLNAQNAVVQNVEVSATSGSSVKTHATKSLNSQTSSGASVRFAGNPKEIKSDNSSGGSTKAIN